MSIEECENLGIGQGMELNWRHCKTCPTMDEYITMVDNSMINRVCVEDELLTTGRNGQSAQLRYAFDASPGFNKGVRLLQGLSFSCYANVI